MKQNEIPGNLGQLAPAGAKIVAAEETRTNVAYGLMPTPDRVQNVVMPQDGLIVFTYQALAKNSNANAGGVAVHLGANRLQRPNAAGAPIALEDAGGLAELDDYGWIITTAQGVGFVGGAGQASGGITTGFTLTSSSTSAPFCGLWAAAGTYDVSVQYKASAGSVTVKERRLLVWTMEFPAA